MGYPLHVGAVTILLFAAAITGSALADGLDNARVGRAALSEAGYDLAIHLFTGAIRSGELSLEDLAHAFYNRGVAYGETAEYDRALQDYTTAIGLAPDFAAAHTTTGASFTAGGVRTSAPSPTTALPSGWRPTM